MAKTFRQEVALILQRNIGNPAKAEEEICKAAKRMGERMPMTAVSARCQREADQYYIAKETDS